MEKYYIKEVSMSYENRPIEAKEKDVEEEIELTEENYNHLVELSKEYNVSIGSVVNAILFKTILEHIEKPEELDEVIDTIYFEKNIKDCLNSNKNYLVVNPIGLQKMVFLAKKETVEKYEPLILIKESKSSHCKKA